MKKVLKFAMIAMTVVAMASCTSKKQASVSEEQFTEVKAETTAQLDSLFNELQGVITGAKLIPDEILDEQKMIKPDYLIKAEDLNYLETLEQKAMAMGMLVVDRDVAALYDMDLSLYADFLPRFAADLNFNVTQFASQNKPVDVDDIKGRIRGEYASAKEAGTTPLFWLFVRGVLSELLYNMSERPAVYVSCLTDESVELLFKRLDILASSAKILAQYSFEKKGGEGVASQVGGTPTADLFQNITTAPKTVEEFKTFLDENKAAIAAHRNGLLK